ncbi:MAG: SPOR domain-containing protein [Alphaproteobacteria bacterium]|nr:SPOR domain-containing protein [Alphaproteobacteria bacterium]
MKELFNNPKEDEYLSEFRQKIAQEIEDDIEQRRHELERSRNGFIGTIAGIALAGLVSWFLLLPKFGYKTEVEVPVIQRPITPVKIRPSEPGGMDIQNQDKMVYALVEKNEGIDTKVESLLPPPETPKMPVIVAQEEVIASNDQVQQEPLKNMDELIEAVETSATEKVKIPEKLPVIDVNVKTVSVASDSLKAQPQIKKEEVKSENKKVEPVQKMTNGRYKVQLMASSKRDALEKGYQTLLQKYPVLKAHTYTIEDGADGLYRLKVGAFENKKDAENLCAQVKKAGGSCMVKE